MDRDLHKLQRELSLAYANFSRVIQELEPEQRRQAGVSGSWSPQEVIAHLIGWDAALQEFILNPDGFDPEPLYDTNAFNATSVSERQHQSWEETIDEWQGRYRALEKAITTVNAEMMIYERVRGWVKGRREDYEHHAHQLEEWIEQNGEAGI